MTWLSLGAKAIGTAALITAAASAQAAIVVAASGPSAQQFPVGRKLDDNQPIILRTGDIVTVLDKQGTRVLRGAGTFKVRELAGATRTSTFAALVRPRASTRVRTGAVRDPSLGIAVRSPNLWYVDIKQPGTYCIIDPATVRLWRAARGTAQSYRISAANGASANVVFQPAEMITSWNPATPPIVEGAPYTLSETTGKAAAAELRFTVLSKTPATPEEAAEMLIARGCNIQVKLLTESLSAPGQSTTN